MRKYPIGQQDFKGIRTGGYVYVDKTKFAYQLATTNKFYFLSRPRRFGKSLFISTLYYLFRGKKTLFEGLYIHDKWEFVEYPVIKISFSDIGYRTSNLTDAISLRLNEISQNYGVEVGFDQEVDKKFRGLIHALYHKYQQQIVVLIDEYDKPIIDYLDQEKLHLARENRGVLKSFYSILKDADAYLKFVFITGVSKFTQVSIFSDLNNLSDITMLYDYNEICGLSQEELERDFEEELQMHGREKIREWYNGYRWDLTKETVYNPFSLLSFFGGGGKYQNFWFATGTPTFLIEKSKAEFFYDFDEVYADGEALQNFDFENIQLIPILFQTGYLTLKGYDDVLNNYILSFPNKEVRESYLRNLADSYINSQINPAKSLLRDLLMALKTREVLKLSKTLNTAFEQIPYDLWQKDNEHFYHAIVHLLFSLLGVYIQSEVHTKDGRADAIVNIDEGIFCMEFKLDKSAALAVQQIREKAYLAPYQSINKPKFLIGINFSSKDKAVEDILWEEW